MQAFASQAVTMFTISSAKTLRLYIKHAYRLQNKIEKQLSYIKDTHEDNRRIKTSKK